MGGNALSQCQLTPKRLPAAEFYRLENKILKSFQARFPGVRIAPIPSYRAKPDFGDLDVLISREAWVEQGGVEALEEWVVQVGHSRGQVRNGPVVSVEWRENAYEEHGFQVDFISSPAAEFDVCRAYYSYNDLGNLVGRIAHKMGMSHGHQGLIYPMRDDTHEFARLVVSQDSSKILSFLGYDPKRFERGFETVEDIFHFASSSPYFNPDIFLLENRNHVSRTRDRKRKTYREFLEWMQVHPGMGRFEFPEDKSEWLPKIFQAFPGFEDQYRQAWDRLQSHRRLKAVFSGASVGKLTGLDGPVLGELMKKIAARHPRDELSKILESEGEQAVRDIILKAAAGRGLRP